MDIEKILSIIASHESETINYTENKSSVRPKLKKAKDLVFYQAINHNYRLIDCDLISKIRPGEGKEIQDYRNENLRQITIETASKMAIECGNAWNGSGFELRNLTEQVTDWLNSKPFRYLDGRLDLNNWVTSMVIPDSFVDPNGGIAVIPITENGQIVRILTPIIPYYKIISNKEFTAFHYEDLLINGINRKAYYVCDAINWYYLKPELIGNSIKYSMDIVYIHNTNSIPIVPMPGVIKKTAKGEYYKETFLQSAYIHGDEAITSYSDAQAISIKSGHPILIIGDIKCDKCTDGKILKPNSKSTDCTNCKGTGFKRSPGPLEMWNYSKEIGKDDKPQNPFYLQPNAANIELSEKRWQKHYELSKRSLGIDSLIDMNESGEAMLKRLEFLKTQIRYILTGVANTLQEVMYYVAVSFHNGEKLENFPSISIPKDISIKNPEVMKAMIDTAVGVERLILVRDHYTNIYSNDPVLVKIMTFIVENYYDATFNTAENLERVRSQEVDSDEIKRANLVLPYLLRESKKDLDFIKRDDNYISNIVETYLNEKYPKQNIDLGGK